MGLRGGRGMGRTRSTESSSWLRFMEALFDGDRPLIDRAALRDVHAAPEQRFWSLQDIEALVEQAALRGAAVHLPRRSAVGRQRDGGSPAFTPHTSLDVPDRLGSQHQAGAGFEATRRAPSPNS